MPVSESITSVARDRRGFTLVELLVAMAVLGIVLASMAALLSAVYTTGTQTVEAGTLQDNARSAVDTLVADLRQAYTGDSTTTSIASFSSTSITFYSPDRQQPFHLRKIAYRLSGNTLQRAFVTSTDTDGPPWVGLTTLGGWQNVASSVVANPGGTSVFSYLKSDGVTPATTASDIDRVTVTVTVKQPGSRNGASTYQSSADLRTFQSS
jgi:prepilin-type N-terminal cleavage/methylation domain-containing protein